MSVTRTIATHCTPCSLRRREGDGCVSPLGGDEPLFDLTPSAEKAIDWLVGLRQRQFVATESRLLTVFELLRQIVEGTERDPGARLAELEKRRSQIENEIRRIEDGDVAL